MATAPHVRREAIETAAYEAAYSGAAGSPWMMARVAGRTARRAMAESLVVVVIAVGVNDESFFNSNFCASRR